MTNYQQWICLSGTEHEAILGVSVISYVNTVAKACLSVAAMFSQIAITADGLPHPSLVPARVPPGEKRSGERSQISWTYYPKQVMTNDIARSVIITYLL